MQSGRRRLQLGALVAVAGALTVIGAAAAGGGGGTSHFKEQLSGYEETPQTLSTTGFGKFKGELNKEGSELTYELSYDSLVGTVTQSHIHFGQEALSGGISVFLCTNLGNGPAGTQACPPPPATISGTLTAADMTAGANGAGDRRRRVRRAGERAAAPASPTSTCTAARYPAGEIRAQIERGGDN